MTLKRAAVEYLQLVGKPQRTTEVRDALLLGGFESGAKKFYNAIHSTLSRTVGVVNNDGAWELENDKGSLRMA